MSAKGWQGRALTSLLSLVSFLVLGITGILLFLMPQGRVAYWVDWQLAGLDKTQWGNIHVLAGLLFLIAGIFHLYYNWRPMIKYLGGKVEAGLRYKKELAVSVLILIWLAVSGIWSLPPLSWVLDWGEAYKGSWIISQDYEPPFGHAEQVSFKSFTRRQGISAEEALKRLEEAGIKVNDPTQSIGAIAAAYGKSPMELYVLIKDLETQAEKPKPGQTWTAELVEQSFSGTGLGQKSLEQVVKQLNLDMDLVMVKLTAAKIEMQPTDKFKDVAGKNNITPLDLLKKILLD